MRWSWINFQVRGVLLVWIRVGQGPTALAVGAGGGCLDIFTLIYPFSFLFPSLWETTRYRLKYCLKGSLSQNQPTNQNFHNNLRIRLSPLKSPILRKHTNPFKRCGMYPSISKCNAKRCKCCKHLSTKSTFTSSVNVRQFSIINNSDLD